MYTNIEIKKFDAAIICYQFLNTRILYPLY